MTNALRPAKVEVQSQFRNGLTLHYPQQRRRRIVKCNSKLNVLLLEQHRNSSANNRYRP